MSDYPSDSAMLMRKILDVQQELERFRVTYPLTLLNFSSMVV